VAELANFPPSVIALAKRKAEELEDYDEDEPASTSVLDSLPEDVTKEGAALIDEFLKTWAARTSQNSEQGEKGTKRPRTADPEAELQELRKVVDEFRPRIEANPWSAKVLESF